MIRAVTLSRLAAAFAMFGLATACSDPQSPRSPAAKASLLPWGGTIAAGNTTTGSDLDPNGYEVWVDDSYSQSPPDNGVSYFNGLSQGDHKVSLIMVAANCLVTSTAGATDDDNPRNVTIGVDETAATTFDVACASVGSLVVGTNTTGVDLDADGYTVTVDGSSQPAATNGSVTFTAPAGANPVALSGVAANCTSSGANPQTVTVPAGGAATTTFAVTCGAPPPAEVSGHVQLGWGSATPGNVVQTFDFDVRADLTGRFTGTDYGDIHPSGKPASLTTDPVADPATSFTAYRNASPSKCQDPTRGVEFDAVGRGDEGDLRSYTVQVCDDDPRNGPGGSGVDFFSVYIAVGGYGRSGIPTSGDIVKR